VHPSSIFPSKQFPKPIIPLLSFAIKFTTSTTPTVAIMEGLLGWFYYFSFNKFGYEHKHKDYFPHYGIQPFECQMNDQIGYEQHCKLPLNRGLAEDRVVSAETGNPGTVGSFHSLGVEEGLGGESRIFIQTFGNFGRLLNGFADMKWLETFVHPKRILIEY